MESNALASESMLLNAEPKNWWLSLSTCWSDDAKRGVQANLTRFHRRMRKHLIKIDTRKASLRVNENPVHR